MRPLILAILGSLLLAGGAWAVASDSELEALLADFRADEAAFEAVRDDLDAEVRAYTRPLFRNLMTALDREVVDDAREQEVVDFVRAVLVAPGPAHSVAKHLHEQTRQAGAEAIQILRRHEAELEGLIGE